MLSYHRAPIVAFIAVATLVAAGCSGGHKSSAPRSPTDPGASFVPSDQQNPSDTTNPTHSTDSTNPTVEAPTLTVASPYALISVNEDEQLTATLALPDGSTHDVTAAVTWSSSDPSVVTISNDQATAGVALGVGSGSTAITASYVLDGATVTSAPVALTVQGEPILRTVAISPENPTLTLGCNTVAAAAFGVYGDDSFTPAPLTAVTWASADETVATVSADGVVTAVGLGTTAITASVEGFAPVTTSVTVTSTTVLAYVAVRPGSIKVGSPRLVNGVVAFSCPVLADTTVELSIANLTAAEPAYAFFADDGGSAVPGAIALTLTSGSTAGFAVTTADPGDGTFASKRVKHRVQITATRAPDASKTALLRVRP